MGATIMGSRNGHAALYLWHTIATKGVAGFSKDVQTCLDNAKFLITLLEEAGVPCMLNKLSSTVVFERPTEGPFIKKWQLACEGEVAHVVVMPSTTQQRLLDFVAELRSSRAQRP